jgi:hypothetical protein
VTVDCPNHNIDAGGNCRSCGYNSDVAYSAAVLRGEDVYGYDSLTDAQKAVWDAGMLEVEN